MGFSSHGPFSWKNLKLSCIFWNKLSLLKQQHSNALCGTQSLQDCWHQCWAMHLFKNIPHGLPLTLPPHLLQPTWLCPGQKGGWLVSYCSWSLWRRLLLPLTEYLTNSQEHSDLPGDRNQPVLPGHPSSPSFPAEIPGAQGGSAGDQRLCPRAHGVLWASRCR